MGVCHSKRDRSNIVESCLKGKHAKGEKNQSFSDTSLHKAGNSSFRHRHSVVSAKPEEVKDRNIPQTISPAQSGSPKPDSQYEQKRRRSSLAFLELKDRVYIEGAPSSKRQQGFEEKRIKTEGKAAKGTLLQNLGIAATCKKGLKPESPNQDDYFILVDGPSFMLGVFDGHGPHGHDISAYVHSLLPQMIIAHGSYSTDMEKTMIESFQNVHERVKKFCDHPSSTFDCVISGTTASVLIYQDHNFYVSHVGDSRAVLAKRVNGELEAQPLTRDHKPTIEEEKRRIESRNGEVKQLPNDVPYRVFMKGKEFPGLSMSRAIGDTMAQDLGVICTPDYSSFPVTDDMEFVLVCSDGVWEFISDKEAVSLVAKFGMDVKDAAEKLSALAWSRWIQNEEDVVDDITVLIAYLPRRGS
jgi:serine/threonine protein phosphatase PrpC